MCLSIMYVVAIPAPQPLMVFYTHLCDSIDDTMFYICVYVIFQNNPKHLEGRVWELLLARRMQ